MELQHTLAQKDQALSKLEQSLRLMEEASFDGTFLWKITNVTRRCHESACGRTVSLFSPAFYTAKYGYKLCLRLYLNGDGTGKKTHLSLFIVIMKGEYDALLPWPFRNKVQGQGKQQGCGVGNRGPGPGLAMNWLCDLGESLALSALSVSPFIKQEPEFTSSSQGSLQRHESRGKNA